MKNISNNRWILVGFSVLVSVPVMHFFCLWLGIYDAQIASGFVWVDNVLHVLTGAAFYCIVYGYTRQHRYSFVLVLALAVGWEFCEYVVYVLDPVRALELKIYSPSVWEAAEDMLSNMLGAVLAFCFGRIVQSHN